MAKVKVKKLNHKEAKNNPFDLRFNKVKHKIVNEKYQSKSNPYQSRNRANELRKTSLLVEYKNRNKSGFVKFVDKPSSSHQNRKQKNTKIKSSDHPQQPEKKRKDNAEYMSEMFEKKRLAQAERDKIDNLKDKLDNQWDQMKSSFMQKELARQEMTKDKKCGVNLTLNE